MKDQVPVEAKSSVLGEWSARQILFATLAVIGVAVVFLLLYRFYMAVFLFFAAVSLKVALDPALVWLQRRGVSRQIGALVVFLLLLAVIAALAWFIAPLLTEQGRVVMSEAPQYYASAREELLTSPVGLVRGLARTLPPTLSLSTLAASTSVPVGAATAEAAASSPWRWIGEGSRWVFALVAVFVLAYYWVLEGDLILRSLTFQARPARREELRELISESEAKIGGFVRGQTILCIIVGGASMVAFFLLGVPNALLLGLIMGIFEAIPVIGPALGAVPAVVMTLAAAPDKVLWVVGVVIVIQVAENNLLVPRIMDESVGVNAVTSMLAIAGFGALFGVPGAILAIPFAAILQIVLNRLLFDAPAMEETANGAPIADAVGRDRIGVLRMQARDLVQAARKQVRAENADLDATAGPADPMDEIEAIANAVDGLLAGMESPT